MEELARGEVRLNSALSASLQKGLDFLQLPFSTGKQTDDSPFFGFVAAKRPTVRPIGVSSECASYEMYLKFSLTCLTVIQLTLRTERGKGMNMQVMFA